MSSKVICWGSNGSGQLTVPFPSFDYSAVSAGALHTRAISGGNLYCWGGNGDGQLDRPIGTFTALSSGRFHSCAINELASLECWGEDGANQASPPSGTFLNLSSGDNHNCAIRTNGRVACSGATAPVSRPADWNVHSDRRRRQPHLRHEEQRQGDLLGRERRRAGSAVRRQVLCSHRRGLPYLRSSASGDVTCWGSNASGQSDPPDSLG